MNTDANLSAAPIKDRSSSQWNYRPDVPLAVSPLFEWPLDLVKVLNWFWRRWFPVSEKLILVATAYISWTYFQPSLEIARNFSFGWVSLMWLRNFILMLIVAGGLHLYFYVVCAQKQRFRFHSRAFGKGRPFLFGDQVLDNMFWTIVSGVSIWTGYEALIIWGFANGYIEIMSWSQNPLWFVAIFFLVPIWETIYFYLIHRLLHWKPLYQLAHHVHHRNSNVGPWSGLSMHPIEHLLFLGSALIHWVILSHPIHLLFHMQYFALTAATTHCGYQSIEKNGREILSLGTFHHQMHHRYIHCNYGGLEVPFDKFFSSFHDGTAQSHDKLQATMRNRARELRQSKK
ncbi:MAG: sterol desaturase family protein [Acidiferrobacterales bacterium]|nr:sterol desaturase family protein [Acidiferrobacterales bacterium]